MPRHRSGARVAAEKQTVEAAPGVSGSANTDTHSHGNHVTQNGRPTQDWFTWFAHETARLSGRPATFLIAVGLIVVWVVTGPFFQFSDTWQLVINTGTTIVTFLMVFLIQNTQNRDTLALQIKLAELIVHMHGARNHVATIEDMCEDDLDALHEAYRKRAEEALETLRKRRTASARRAEAPE